MAKITTQQTHALISLFLKKYKDKYGKEPLRFNRYRDKWGFQSMAEDLGVDRAKEVIEYYFDTNKMGHPTSYLMNNYDKINERMIEKAEDVIKRKQLMQESAKRVAEWRAKRGE
jgi:hypothetical protein